MEEAEGLGNQRVPIRFILNGEQVELSVEPRLLLLDMLRDRFGLKGAKRSCDMQVCGACTVLVNGEPVSACTHLAFEARESHVLTIEGLADEGRLHPLMESFISNAGLQCGYCTPGMLLTAKSLLDSSPQPTQGEIRDYMRGNICRCTGYKKIVESILEAAGNTA